MLGLEAGSTWKVSAMQDVAISMDSASSGVRVPSLRDVWRKSIMARESFFLESRVEAWRALRVSRDLVGLDVREQELP